jgi:hypothetical protein
MSQSDTPNNVPRHFRIEPTHTIRSYREIGRMKRVRLHEFQHFPVNDWPLRFHQVKHKCRPICIIGMKKANCWIVSIG